MIFSEHGQPLLGWIQRRAFGNCPGAEDAFHFDAEIVVKAGGAMLLNDEAVAAFLSDFAGRLGSLIELSLPSVLFKAHWEYDQ